MGNRCTVKIGAWTSNQTCALICLLCSEVGWIYFWRSIPIFRHLHFTKIFNNHFVIIVQRFHRFFVRQGSFYSSYILRRQLKLEKISKFYYLNSISHVKEKGVIKIFWPSENTLTLLQKGFQPIVHVPLSTFAKTVCRAWRKSFKN